MYFRNKLDRWLNSSVGDEIDLFHSINSFQKMGVIRDLIKYLKDLSDNEKINLRIVRIEYTSYIEYINHELIFSYLSIKEPSLLNEYLNNLPSYKVNDGDTIIYKYKSLSNKYESITESINPDIDVNHTPISKYSYEFIKNNNKRGIKYQICKEVSSLNNNFIRIDLPTTLNNKDYFSLGKLDQNGNFYPHECLSDYFNKWVSIIKEIRTKESVSKNLLRDVIPFTQFKTINYVSKPNNKRLKVKTMLYETRETRVCNILNYHLHHQIKTLRKI